MRSAHGLGPIVREETERGDLSGVFRPVRSIRGSDPELDEWIQNLLEMEAGAPRCTTRVAQLPLQSPVPYVGTRAGTLRLSGIVFTGWSGWRGAYSFAQLYGTLQPRATGGIFSQNCMVYRYRFNGVGLGIAGYIGSATGRNSLRQRLRREITINAPDSSPAAGGESPEGLQHIIRRLQTAAGRRSFRFDIGSIIAPGIRNTSNVFILEKLLQFSERPYGNPQGVRTFEDSEDSPEY